MVSGTEVIKEPTIMIAGAGGLGAMAPMGFAGMGINGAVSGPLSGLNGTPSCGAATVQLQQLSQLIDGFTSAEILMALMIAAASCKHGKDDDQSGALAMLAGMALASQLGGIQGLDGCQPWSGMNGGGLGGQLNAVA